MTIPFSRRMMLAGLTAAIASPALADPLARSLRPRPRSQAEATPVPATARVVEPPEQIVQAARLGGVTGFVVIEAASGRVLEAVSPDASLPPASVAKTITSLYALEKLGADHRFRTRVLATGPVVQGVVQGDLILSGSGDPSLTTDQLGDLAARLSAAGVKGVTGGFLAHAGALPALSRLSADQPEHVGYNPGLSGLNLNFNRVHFEWKRAGTDWALSMDARAERFVPPVAMSSVRIVQRDTPLFTYEDGASSDGWTVASKALGKGGSRWLPVRHPAIYTAEVFRTLAAAQGIRLPPATLITSLPAAAQTELALTTSDPLDGILRDMLKFSTNLTAECVGLSSSGGGTLDGSGQAMTDWAGARFGMASQFHGHSGLDGRSRSSATDMARALLAADRAGAGLRGILREIGMRDEKGKPVEDSPVRVLAKTGTLNFCSGLAGFICPPNGRDLVFAIFSADVPRREAVPPQEREQPAGLHPWLGRARGLQGRLITRWAGLYTA
ncbi:MAG: D-alanyl-D-alanine carboxypeptidase [Paracoccaceae bacterium]